MPKHVRRSLSVAVSFVGVSFFSACTHSPPDSPDYAFPGDWRPAPAPIDSVLVNYHQCNEAWAIRHQSLSEQQVADACQLMAKNETLFHQLFNTQRQPVAHDHNQFMVANIYASAEEYQRHAGKDFGIDTDNGGMYLEGYPDWHKNSANFIAYQRGDTIWNLRHEMVHYLDGRFNVYGDFCAGLHNNHAAPEYCPQPAPLLPHLTWWTEGVAEYVANGTHNPGALALAGREQLPLSEVFNNTTERGTDRVYRWGYLAVRFMIEQQPEKVEQMLSFTRKGDFARYQALVKGWGTSMDAEFARWLSALD
ncbi:collagenase [Simiduia agarivorans]|uniref:Collagenase n=1 Tax=Simiduia agarivorans (strain DSM 21679 / JCM 13881 / BCRC 17597 / SA1) TaxID=1117647 RepID=K4KID7_SIMAS|nr:collagenase [Simiduia agarivorans]AFU97970.1 collagenase [Simiduia agarivorans SA1 = DSM 21679]